MALSKPSIIVGLLTIAFFEASGVLAVDFSSTQISAGIQYEYFDIALELDGAPAADPASSSYAGQPVYIGLALQPTDPALVTGSAPGVTNGAAISFGSNGGAKLQLNGPFPTRNEPGTDAGRYAAGDVITGLFLFQKEDFNNGLNSGPIFSAANQSMRLSATVRLDRKSPERLASGQLRWVVKAGGAFYISEEVVSLTASATQTVSGDSGQYVWRAYAPATAIEDRSGALVSLDAQAVEAVGFWLETTVEANNGIRAYPFFGIEQFQVEALSLNPETNAVVDTCVIDASVRHQKMEGFGASAAFYQNLLVNHQESAAIADLLFDDLKLDILRLRNVYDQNNWQQDFVNFRDTYQLGTNSLGRDIKVLLSAWTPPAYLKSNGVEAGETVEGAEDGTLAKDGAGNYRYADFATWWADALDYYQANGIPVEYVSIQNEPNWHPLYDGCAFEPSETTSFAGYDRALETVWRTFAERYGRTGMPKLIGPEPIGINRLDEYIAAINNLDHIYGYAHHYYQMSPATNPDVLNTLMASTKSAFDYKPLMQTEYAHLKTHTISAVERKLNQAKLMHNGLTIEGLSAYLYWALFWTVQAADQEGLINISNNSTGSYSINPEYYGFKHYSAFVHSDWRRVEASAGTNEVSLSAFVSPDRDQMSVILINENSTPVDMNIAFSNVTILAGSVYRTTDQLDCEWVSGFSGSSVVLPGESITTLALTTQPLAAPAHTNILMISIDDLRPQLRSYGVPQMKTPHLDQLALDGYQFNRAYVQQAVCGPSRASIMTGLRPDRTGAYQYNSNFRDTMPWVYTLPQTLSEQGYFSTAIGKIYHVINGQNDPLSWDEDWLSGSGIYGATGNAPYENYAGSEGSLRDGAVTDAAVTKLAELKSQQPFFYGVGYVRPHLPFVAPSSYWDLYSIADLEQPYTDSPAVNASSYAFTTWGELRSYSGIPASGPVSAVQEQNLIHGYYACVSFVDAQVGRLMEALQEQGLSENTIVVVWGDHGYHLGDHGEWCKHTNFERATRIPLIVKVPWMPGASRVDALVEALDIYPTLLELCGLEAPAHLQGESLVPLLENPAAAGPAEAVSQYPRNAESIMGYAMRTERYRYVEWRSAGSDTPADVELYDHFMDPGEDTNVVASADAALLASLSAQLSPYVGEAYRAQGSSEGTSFATYLLDAGMSGAAALIHADADGDGVDNLMEYALNLNPALPDGEPIELGSGTAGLPAADVAQWSNQGSFAVEYIRRKDADEIRYQISFADTLTEPSWMEGSETSVTPIDANWERVRVADPNANTTNTSRFGRLQVELDSAGF